MEYHLQHSFSLVVKQIKKNAHVDNVQLSANSTQETIQIYQNAKIIFWDAKMDLRASVCNDSAIDGVFWEEDKAHQTQLKVLRVW